MREPDHFLGVDVSSLGAVLGNILIGIEKVLLAERPNAFLVLGDTNSGVAAIMAKRLRIPVYHMEAGNRCYDANVPEEVNRRLIDHLADFNLAYTEHARRNLLGEGLEPRRVFCVFEAVKTCNGGQTFVSTTPILQPVETELVETLHPTLANTS